MFTKKTAIALASIAVGALVFGAAANSAQAQFCYYAAPVVTPVPVVVAPAPVVVAPPVYAPAPVYYSAPVYRSYGYVSYNRPYYRRSSGFSFGFSYYGSGHHRHHH